MNTHAMLLTRNSDHFCASEFAPTVSRLEQLALRLRWERNSEEHPHCKEPDPS